MTSTSHHPLCSHGHLLSQHALGLAVTEISLPGAGLNRTLGVFDFATFLAFTKLNHRSNSITGIILVNATGLTYLDLWQNSLSREISDTLPATCEG